MRLESGWELLTQNLSGRADRPLPVPANLNTAARDRRLTGQRRLPADKPFTNPKQTLTTSIQTITRRKQTMTRRIQTMTTPKQTLTTPVQTMTTTVQTITTPIQTMTRCKQTMTTPVQTITTPKQTMTRKNRILCKALKPWNMDKPGG